MAATSSAPNLFSFFNPSNPSPSYSKTPPSNLYLSSATTGQWDPLVSSDSNPSADLISVISSSLAHANTLFFRSAYNVQVIVDDNEPEEKLLGRFRREVMKAGLI